MHDRPKQLLWIMFDEPSFHKVTTASSHVCMPGLQNRRSLSLLHLPEPSVLSVPGPVVFLHTEPRGPWLLSDWSSSTWQEGTTWLQVPLYLCFLKKIRCRILFRDVGLLRATWFRTTIYPFTPFIHSFIHDQSPPRARTPGRGWTQQIQPTASAGSEV